ncbi:hypothetical protein Ga0080559_TMP1978 [Salipiger profundus]|uniref:Uncharacterized protein n=1 Tax=Salipiger profundus TaxID=1229727 RepID=A0A1U7D3N1_9RHOB|nr:hypothetical protein Ga0080559_TMP1978 [Salipiger profundus]
MCAPVLNLWPVTALRARCPMACPAGRRVYSRVSSGATPQ